MTARSALRTATRPDHERVDRIYSRFDLRDALDYRRFLSAQAAAHIPVEDALDRGGAGALIPDWARRRRAHLLRDDLAETGAELPEGRGAPEFPGVPALLGGLYVIEGSRLGGALLRRSLPPGAPARFLGAPGDPGAWRSLLATMDDLLPAPDDVRLACEAARAVFRVFENAGRESAGRENGGCADRA